MRKLWIILLSVGLIAAFCMPAAAMDFKMSGSYFIQGIYENNRSLIQPGSVDPNAGYPMQSSMAYEDQRLRLEPVFKVAEGLNLNMRIDAMERAFGQFPVGQETNPSSIGALDTRNPAQEQNIQFRRVWVDFITPIGMFIAGYVGDGAFGPDFGDIPSEGPMIVYVLPIQPFVLIAGCETLTEGRLGYTTNLAQFGGSPTQVIKPGYVDSDMYRWVAGATYHFTQGEAGFIYQWMRGAQNRPVTLDMVTNPYYPPYDIGFTILHTHLVMAYFKTNFGPLYVEGEYDNWWGKMIEWDKTPANVGMSDVNLESWQAYLMAKYNIGPTYIGGQWGFSSGQKPDKSKDTAFPEAGYQLWQPCLILFEDWTNKYGGPLGGYAQLGNAFANASLYQIFAGWNPIPKLSTQISFTWADADQKTDIYGNSVLSKNYGKELDITATYKIFDNLSYKVGFAYLWTGDYFKGSSSTNQIDNDYLLMHQLTLSF